MLVEFSHAFIISDLHIGLPFFERNSFLRFLKNLPRNCALILNGDTIDNPYKKLNEDEQSVLSAIIAGSYERPTIWIYGNHDADIVLPASGKIVFAHHIEIAGRLMVVHGDDFEDIMSRVLLLIRVFKVLHDLRILLGADPVHVAQFAKKWFPFLYRILTEEVKRNAILCAKENGYPAITCGHVHYREESVAEGIRYLNTGTWTEKPLSYIEVTPKSMTIKTFE